MSLWQFIWYIQWNLKTLTFDNTIIWNRGHSAVALLVMFYIKIPLRDTRFLKVEQYSLYVFLLVYVSNWLIVQWRYDIHLKGSWCFLLWVASLRSQDNLLEFLFLQRQLALISGPFTYLWKAISVYRHASGGSDYCPNDKTPSKWKVVKY